MSKIQILEHDVSDGLLPQCYAKPIAEWVHSHDLTFVRSFKILGDRLVGIRYLANDEGRHYIWHTADHTRHIGGTDCCTVDDEREVAWEMYNVPVRYPIPVFELATIPSAIYVDPETRGIHEEGCTAINRDPECSCGAYKRVA